MSETHLPRTLEELRTAIERCLIDSNLHRKNIQAEINVSKKLEGKPLVDYHSLIACTVEMRDTFRTDVSYRYYGYLQEPVDPDTPVADLERRLPPSRSFEDDFTEGEREKVIADVWKVFQLYLSELRNYHEGTDEAEEGARFNIDVDLSSGTVVVRGPRGTETYGLADLPAE